MAILHPTDRRFSYAEGDQPLSGYTIDHPLGRGGFGEVYAAHSQGGKEVALKLITEGDLSREINVLNLSHPHLVPIFDVRQEAGENWIVMEYLSGGTLADLLDANPRGLTEDETMTIMCGLLEGLDYLHQKSIIHRDLKPGNLLFDADGRPRIGDYGLSKAISESQGSRGTREVGSIHYMAPEIFNGKSGKASDIYACGIILHELLTGTVPFDGESQAEIMRKHLMDAPNLKNLPTAWKPVIETALAKDANSRYTSALEMLEAIEQITGQPPTERAKPIQVPVSKAPQKRGWLNSLWCSLIGAEPKAHQSETHTVSSAPSQQGTKTPCGGWLRIRKAEVDFHAACHKYEKLRKQRDQKLGEFQMDSPHLASLNEAIARAESEIHYTCMEYSNFLKAKIQKYKAKRKHLLSVERLIESSTAVEYCNKKIEALKAKRPNIKWKTAHMVDFSKVRPPQRFEADISLPENGDESGLLWLIGIPILLMLTKVISEGVAILILIGLIVLPLLFFLILLPLFIALVNLIRKFSYICRRCIRFIHHSVINLLVAMLPKSEV